MEYNPTPEGGFVPPPNEQNQYNFGQPAAPSADQALINAYIGNNADAIYLPSNGVPRYNWAAALLGLFFGPIWFFYRKCYLVGFGFLLLTILFRISSAFSHSLTLSLLVLGCHMVLAALYFFFANSIYLSGVKKKVNNLKTQYPQSSTEQLVQIVRYKGGVSIPAVVGYSITLLVVIIISVVLSVLGFLKTANAPKGDQLKIFDGLGTISFKKGMLSTFSDTPGNGKPSSDIVDEMNFVLISPNDKAETMFAIYHTSDFQKISSVQQYLTASGLTSKIKSSKNETSKKFSVLGVGSEEMSAVITRDTTDKYPTHKYVLNASLGKYYSIVALTRIREQDIKSSEANEWLSYMKTVKVIDNNRKSWSPANIIGEPLYHQIGRTVNMDQLGSQNSGVKPDESPAQDSSQGTSSGTLKSDGTQIDISWPSGYKNTYSSNYIISLDKDSGKYEVKLSQDILSTIDSYVKDNVMSDYDYKSKESSYKNLRMSEPSMIVGDDGREYKVIRVDYTYDLGFGSGTDYEDVYAATQIDKDNVYAVEITSMGETVPDSMIKDFFNIKVSNYSEN